MYSQAGPRPAPSCCNGAPTIETIPMRFSRMCSVVSRSISILNHPREPIWEHYAAKQMHPPRYSAHFFSRRLAFWWWRGESISRTQRWTWIRHGCSSGVSSSPFGLDLRVYSHSNVFCVEWVTSSNVLPFYINVSSSLLLFVGNIHLVYFECDKHSKVLGFHFHLLDGSPVNTDQVSSHLLPICHCGKVLAMISQLLILMASNSFN